MSYALAAKGPYAMNNYSNSNNSYSIDNKFSNYSPKKNLEDDPIERMKTYFGCIKKAGEFVRGYMNSIINSAYSNYNKNGKSNYGPKGMILGLYGAKTGTGYSKYSGKSSYKGSGGSCGSGGGGGGIASSSKGGKSSGSSSSSGSSGGSSGGK